MALISRLTSGSRNNERTTPLVWPQRAVLVAYQKRATTWRGADREAAALSGRTLHDNPAAVCFRHVPHESQAHPAAAPPLGLAVSDTVELLEDAPLLGARDADALVGDRQGQRPVADRRLDAKGLAVGRILDRVVDEVGQRLGDRVGVEGNFR